MKIVYRKLGKEKAWGQAHNDDMIIELDPRLKGKHHLTVLIHEILHLQNPSWSETEVINKSRQMANQLWKENYRRIDK